MKRIKQILGIFLLLSCSLFAGINYRGVDQNKEAHSLKDYQGQYVVMVFWATWCPPCRGELPHIQKMYEDYGKNKKEVVFLGMNDQSRKEVTRYLEGEGLNFPTLIGRNPFPVRAYPTIIILDQKGEMMENVVGALPEEVLRRYIDENLLGK